MLRKISLTVYEPAVGDHRRLTRAVTDLFTAEGEAITTFDIDIAADGSTVDYVVVRDAF
jgi:hypothetical protein